MRFTALISIDNEKLYEAYRSAPLKDKRLEIVDLLEDGIKDSLKNVDNLAHVEVRMG